MIVALLGKSGAGKSTIAKAMERYVKDSFIIDGDALRAEKKNYDLGTEGRNTNQILGFKRARKLSDLGFTVFMAMQSPTKEIRDKYLNENDIEIIIENIGINPKDEKGYNRHFYPNYTGITNKFILQDFTPESFYDKFFPKVLVPARFQGFHKGHKVVLEEAKRLSPNVTIGLRVDDEDLIDLEKNMELLRTRGYKVIKTPGIHSDWTNFANQFDIYVQGNPMVIDKFKKSKCKLYHVPRYGDVSGTGIRASIAYNKDVGHNIDKDVEELIKESL